MRKNLIKGTGIIILVLIFVASCKHDKKDAKAMAFENCTAHIIEQDVLLGKQRNWACKDTTLSKSIMDYCYELNQLPFEGCPTDFIKAFQKHIVAWKNMIEITDDYSDLRGEMHDLFDSIAISRDSLIFKSRLKSIWDTWSEIENAMK